MKIVILDSDSIRVDDAVWDEIAVLGELVRYDYTPQELAAARIGDAEVVLLSKIVVDEALLDACPNLQYIGVTATGYNVVDLAATARRGIVVTNVPAYSTEAVAQHTFALLLELADRVAVYDARVKAGEWKRADGVCLMAEPQMELLGKTFCVVGMGQIGRRTARIAQAFGMKTVAVVRRADTEPIEGVEYLPMEEAFARADVISLHCPLTAGTEHLICAETLALMKPGAILINTSRGPLCDEQAVADALRAGTLGAFAADVLAREPMGETPLEGAPRCILTPHIAWAPYETRCRLVSIVAQNLRSWLAGEPQNRVG